MADGTKSFLLRYVGDRFNGTRLPVEVLSDLSAFRDLLVAFAKEKWRDQHGRERVPKGFDKSLSFDLVEIKDGSAVPKLEWNHNVAQANLPDFVDEIEQIVGASYDTFVKLVDDAAAQRYPKSLSVDHIRALNRLGSGLKDGERIEFMGSQGGDGKVVYLDSVRRKQLITRVKETYQARVESVGRLVGTYVEGSIRVFTAEYGEIEIPVDPDKVKKVFDGNLQADVQFDIQIELDNNDRYRSVVDVFDTGLVDAQIGANLAKCRERVEEISALATGWLDGAGAATDDEAVGAAHRFLSKRPSLCGAYRIYPTEDGGLLFEFERNGWDLSVQFLAGGHVEFYGVQVDGDEEIEPRQFDELSDEFMAEFDKQTSVTNG